MFSKYKLVIFGGIVGLIAPIIALWLYYIYGYSNLDFSEFIDRLLYSTLFGPVLSLCVLINLLMFFCFIWLNRDEGSWGVLLSTIIYAFIVFGFKFFH